MEYLLKVSAVVTIFYICYKMFLQRDTFFQQNRCFLLLGLITSFLVPYFVIPIYIEQEPILIPDFNFANNTVAIETPIPIKAIETPFNILKYIPFIYGLGVFFFFIRFIIQLSSLAVVIYKSKKSKEDCYIHIKSNDNITPFSFFNWIVYNPKQFNEIEIEQVITHEKAHVNQYHSIDVLLTQISCIVLWFNPIMWLYNKELKQNLEFVADHKTQEQFNCKKSYQQTLLKTSLPSHQMVLNNNFYNSSIKKRIVMLHKSKSKKVNLIKYALVVPMLAYFLMSFNTEHVYVKKETPVVSKVLKKSNIEIAENFEFIIDKNTTNKDFENAKKSFWEKFKLDFTYNNIKRNFKNEIVALKIKLEGDKKGLVTANYYESEGVIKPFKIFHHTDGTIGTRLIDKNAGNIEEFIFKNNFSDEELKSFTNKLENKGYTFKIIELERNKFNLISRIYFKIRKNDIEGEYRIGSYSIKDISIQYLKKEKVFNINTVEFKNNLNLLANKKDVFEIRIDKNTTNENLEKQKAILKDKHNLKFEYEIIERNSKNEIINLSYGVSGLIVEQSNGKPIEPVIIKYNPENNSIITYGIDKKGIPLYGNTQQLGNKYSFIFTKDHTQKSFDNIIKKLKTKYGITAKFNNIKRNNKKEITAITIDLMSKKRGVTYTFNPKKPIDNFSISFYGKGNKLQVSKYHGNLPEHN